MNTYPPRTGFLHRVAAALLLAAVLVAASGRAVASCGDYVTIAGQPGGHGQGKMTPPHPTGDGPDRLPCQGPSCSGDRHPAQLPLTTPVKFTSGAKELADRLAAGSAEADGRHRFLPAASEGRPIDLSQPIYHPPRQP